MSDQKIYEAIRRIDAQTRIFFESGVPKQPTSFTINEALRALEKCRGLLQTADEMLGAQKRATGMENLIKELEELRVYKQQVQANFATFKNSSLVLADLEIFNELKEAIEGAPNDID
jgi:hypothetical protein